MAAMGLAGLWENDFLVVHTSSKPRIHGLLDACFSCFGVIRVPCQL